MRLRGKQHIQSVPGLSTRPTSARVREAIFNIWQFEIASCRWLDLCAGTGAMGAEALCRNASIVVGIEQSKQACTVVKQNWQRIAQPHQQIRVIQADVRRGLDLLANQQFDRIYFDPPYASDLYLPTLEAIAQGNHLANTGILAVEHDRSRVLPQQIGSLQQLQVRHYGKTAITFYQRELAPAKDIP